MSDAEAHLAQIELLSTELEAIRTREQAYLKFLRSIADQVYRYSIIENRYDFVSDSLANVWGVPTEEFNRDPAYHTKRLTLPEHWDNTWALIRKHHETPFNPEPVIVEYQITRDDGTVLWLHDLKSYEYDSTGKPIVINGIIRDITSIKRTELELRNAMQRVKELSGLLPICASCKKIRNDSGYWDRLEEYFGNTANIRFTHGICPECASEMEKEISRMSVKKPSH